MPRPSVLGCLVMVAFGAGCERAPAGSAGIETRAQALSGAAQCPPGTNPILGTDGPDTLIGTAGADCILGLGGADTIDGRGGDDFIAGGDGDDQLAGGNGDDHIEGGPGADAIEGGQGDDTLAGGPGADTLAGGEGADRIDGEAGADRIEGGQGDDTLAGGAGDDAIAGGEGDDAIDGGEGDDAIEGGNGIDRVEGGAGNDLIRIARGVAHGGDGDDAIAAEAGALVEGGAGIDACAPRNPACELDLDARACQPDTPGVEGAGLAAIVRCAAGATCDPTSRICVRCRSDLACPGGSQCEDARCQPAAGCRLTSAPDGRACDDGNACTRSDACAAGACAGTDPVTCTALDACHDPGTCDPTTGLCSNPSAPDGRACDDGNACTRRDACAAGACAGSDPVACTALDACHDPGTCDPATGLCSNPSAPDGRACDDGNACTRRDACAGGACSGGDPVVCAGQGCQVAGVCDPETGACSAPSGCNCGNGVRDPGEGCDDGNRSGGDGCSPICTDERIFRVRSYGATGCAIVDHDAITGDDRGGIALSASSLLYTGDGSTGRFSAADLSGAAPIGEVLDTLAGDLLDPRTFFLADAAGNDITGSGVATRLVRLDDSGGRTAETIPLSTPIALTGGDTGIFSGYGRVVVHSGGSAFDIDLRDGRVTTLGRVPIPSRSRCENGAFWGVVNAFGGTLHLDYVRDFQTIARTRVDDGSTSVVATFQNLSDMCSFTVSVARGRWYFHHEGSAQFGTGSELAGFCSASFSHAGDGCGDGVLDPAREECDDFGRLSGDGCSELCEIESCGNGRLDFGEVCDDGNNVEGDGCGCGCRAQTGTDPSNCGGCGVVCPSGVACLGGVCDTRTFRITSLGQSSCQSIEHFPVTGDDSGGIAVSPAIVLYTGDNGTGRFSAADLSAGATLPVRHDSLTGDLLSGQIYALGDAQGPLPFFGGTATRLIALDRVNGALTSESVQLSQPITAGSGTGIFAGYGRVVLVTGAGRIFDIRLPEGRVSDLGTTAPLPHTSCESWAYWGTAELFDGALHVDYVRDSRTIVRTRLSDGTTTPIATFANLGDACSFGFSRARNRWYFKHEGTSQFRTGDETLGFCEATWDGAGRPAGSCGDLVASAAEGEECDDGNQVVGDGCAACLREVCGNRRIDFGEQCDDGNTAANDGCDARCVIERCGDGLVQPGIGEECEDGNTVDGDGCSSRCLSEICGNQRVDFGEQCDDGNTVDSDGCGCGCRNTAFDESNCGGCGITCAAHEACLGGTCDGETFRIGFYGSTNCRVVDHGAATGDDRAGIAVTPTSVLYTGDTATARFNASDLGGAAGLGVRHDMLVGDLKSGAVYQLASGTTPLTGASGVADGLLRIDPASGAFTGERVVLSAPINLVTGAGLFSGFGRLVVHANNRVFDVALPSGRVADLGAMPALRGTRCESGLLFGTAELFDNALWLSYATQTSIERRRVPDGLAGIATAFSNLGDTCAFTFSRWTNRWYFKHEGSSQFRATSFDNETIGFCDSGFSTPGRAAACGDGVLDAEGGEQCDDGNRSSDDGCSARCVTERCGDGLLQPGLGEQCEGGIECTSSCKYRCVDGADLGSALGRGIASGSTARNLDRMAGSCGGAGAPDASFAWTAPSAGRYTFDTFGSTFDTVLHVHDGACGGAELGCSDDATSPRSSVTVELASGQRVVIAVDGKGPPGAFVLNASRACAANISTTPPPRGFPLVVAEYEGAGLARLDALGRAERLALLPPLLTSVAGDPLGTLYTCTEGGRDVLQVDAEGTRIYASGFEGCGGLLLGPDRVLYVAEPYAGRVSAIDPGGTVRPFAEGLMTPMQMAFDSDGTILVAEHRGARVSRLDANGIRSLVAEVEHPLAIAVGPDDNLYVSQPFSRVALVRVDRCGAVSAVTDHPSGATGLAFGPGGLLYVGQPKGGAINVLDTTTATWTTFTSGLGAPLGMAFTEAP